jgi:glucose-1-phosphate thymidylyltransferase
VKALIASGGRGTRLRPLTHTQNKHLIPVANKPILFYAIETVAEAGIRDVAIVYNGESDEVPKFVGSGAKWGLKITYIPQPSPGGLAQVVQLAENFIQRDKFIFYLGDNMVVGGVGRFIEEFEKGGLNCLLTISEVKEPQRFGVPVFKDGELVRVEEKPKNPQSKFAVAGIYLYDRHIFEAVKSLKPSARGELEISDAHTFLIERGYKVGFKEITGWWKDTGKADDLLEANRLVLENMTPAIDGQIDQESQIEGKLSVGRHSKIARSTIRGPVIVGESCVIEDSFIGPFTSIGDRTEIRESEVENSIILKDCKIRSGKTRIDRSIIGNDVEIGRANGSSGAHRFMIGDQSRIDVV